MSKDDNIPVPDPSTLTTFALAWEVAHMTSLQSSRDHLVDERFEAVNRLLEEVQVRHQQRFDAQTKALDAAFLSAQTAVGAALTAADKGIQAAMSASEKAVVKAEIAAEKRLILFWIFRSPSVLCLWSKFRAKRQKPE